MALDSLTIKAFEAAEADGTREALTIEGKPRTEFVEAQTGRVNISAEERDALWDEYLSLKEAGAAAEEPGPETAVAAPPTPAAPAVYIGPALTAPVFIGRNTIFKGGRLPDRLADRLAGDTDLARLIVPLAGLGPALAELKIPDSDLARAYRAVAARPRERS